MDNAAFDREKGPEFYAELFECAGDAIFVETADGRILDANPAACKLLGYTKQELLSLNVMDFLDTAEQDAVRRLVDAMDSNGESYFGYNIRKDGRKVPVEVRIRSYQKYGEPRLIVIARDITQQVRDLEEIRKQNEYMLLLHEMNIGALDRLDMSGLLNNLIIRAGEMFGTPDAFVYFVNDERGVLELKAGTGRNAKLYGYTQSIGHGAVGRVAATGEALVIEDYPEWPERTMDPQWDTLKTCICIPFKSGEKVIGVLGLDYFDARRSFTPAETMLIGRFAELASMALVKANMHTMLVKSEQELQQKNEALTLANERLSASEEELRQQFDQLLSNEERIRRQNMVLTLLNRTALGLMQELDINEELKMIVASATELFGTFAHIGLVDEARGVVELKVGAERLPDMQGFELRLGEGVAGSVAQTGQPLMIENYPAWSGRSPDSRVAAVQTCACVPLKAGGKVIGVLGLQFYYPRAFSAEDMEMLGRFAELASIAIHNAKLVHDYKNEIQEHIRAEAALRASENRYKNLYGEYEEKQALLVSLINSIPDLIFYKDSDSVYLGCNKAFEEFAGMKEKELVGLTDLDIFDEGMAELFRKMDKEMLRKGEPRRNEEFVTYPDGKKVLLETLKTPYYDYHGKALGLIGISRDITERKKKEDEIVYLSLHDALTGLYNRAFFEEEMKRLENVRDLSAGIVVCDVDGLKLINDTLGHNTGDYILRAVAEILTDSFRAGDIVARIGGDEFAVLIEHNSARVLEGDCHRIRKQIGLYNAENPTMPISLSIGFAVSRGASVDMNALFREADNNMYREKLHQDKSSRSAIVQTLMKALEARDFQTEGHSDRMQEYVVSFANALDLPEQSLADLRLLARFHDIGKVGIPDSILFKAGRLTEEELLVMRQHCEIGYRIALSAPDLAPIADWILKHQEWWNGQGYPLGIAGDDIPLACRMLSIVDAFDAMTSDRPYRKAMRCQAAIEELNRCAGIQFDPELVEKFTALEVCRMTGNSR